MKRYYRSAQQVSTLNEMLLAFLMNRLLPHATSLSTRSIEEINENFKLVDGKLMILTP